MNYPRGFHSAGAFAPAAGKAGTHTPCPEQSCLLAALYTSSAHSSSSLETFSSSELRQSRWCSVLLSGAVLSKPRNTFSNLSLTFPRLAQPHAEASPQSLCLKGAHQKQKAAGRDHFCGQPTPPDPPGIQSSSICVCKLHHYSHLVSYPLPWAFLWGGEGVSSSPNPELSHEYSSLPFKADDPTAEESCMLAFFFSLRQTKESVSLHGGWCTSELAALGFMEADSMQLVGLQTRQIHGQQVY